MRTFTLFCFLLTLAFGCGVLAASPLRYHSFAIVTVEASVQAIDRYGSHANTQLEQQQQQRSPSQADFKAHVIALKILRLVDVEMSRLRVDLPRPGDTIKVTNQFLNHKPPFTVGGKIRARLRLVLPDDHYDPSDNRQQWWFYPADEIDDITPPTDPYRGIILMD